MKTSNIITLIASIFLLSISTMTVSAQRGGHPGMGPRMGAAPMRSAGPGMRAMGSRARMHAPVARFRGGFGFAPRYADHPVYLHSINPLARLFYVGGNPYYTYGGVYYRYVPSYGYEEVIMPQEVIVAELPATAKQVYVDDVEYYTYNGIWYTPTTGGFVEVEDPTNTIAEVVEPVTTTRVVTVARPGVRVYTY